ncbi:MAG: 3-dehydroquinate synthase [Deltaproteobacteria bacterium]|nr:3-dehydroquinate synthase [Deltaproteobacteria bacterium]
MVIKVEKWVRLGERSYPLYVTCGDLDRLGETMAQFVRVSRWVVVTQRSIPPSFRRSFEKGLKRKAKVLAPLYIPNGERFKTVQTASRLYGQLAKARVERGDGLVALGGGVVGDLTGFVASTYLRGVPYVQIPTTLLAQVDSSIGGKTGVDLPVGKNLVGTFAQPRAVGIDVAALLSLPEREFRSGLAEVVKYGVIGELGFLGWLEAHRREIVRRDLSKLRHMVEVCAGFKSRVVGLDERETKGIRSILNFGHTLGHAMEVAGGYQRYRHGEAISMGMIFALRLGEALGITSRATLPRVSLLLKGFGLPIDPPRVSWSAIERALRLDKKIRDGKLRMLLAKRVGEVKVIPISFSSVRKEWNFWTGE